MGIIRETAGDARHLGLTASVRLFLSRRALGRFYGGDSRLKLRGLDHDFHFRHGTSDKYVVREIFKNEQYKVLSRLESPRLIVDCGANIGATSVYLLRRFPGARLVAIEPDPGNFAVLERNLTPYRDRVQLVRRAVWPTEGSLRLERGTFRDGREWSIQVRECLGEESGEVSTITPEGILKLAGCDIDLMKLDVEGAERALFADPERGWLDRVRCLAIELHDGGCRDAFFEALAGFDYRLQRSGELTICWDLRRRDYTGSGVPGTAVGDIGR